MALKFTRKPSEYFSETAYVYDIAQSSQNFDKSVYEGLASSGNEDALQQYLYGIAGAKDKVMTAFNQTDYDYLSVEDKAKYTLNLLHNDPNSEEYKYAMKYFDDKVQEAVDKETYESLNDFERTINSIGGMIGNALNETILGTVEGLVDLGAVIFGQKDWAAEDFTGVGANREALQQYSRAYTYLDKNKAWSIANDVATGISQMSIMFIPYVGQVLYFGAMAGNTAADAVRANPDIDYLSLIGYTAAVTGVEFATEKISGKLLGGAGNVIDQKVFGKVAGKGLTKLGEMAAGSWVARIGLNFLSEGLEESIAEFADTVLFNMLVDNKPFSVQDIIYAGLIGGLIGGIMEGGRIATTSKLSITKDGDVVLTKDAKKLGVEAQLDLTKTQSLTFSEQLAQAKAAIQTDAVADLQTKYADLSLKQIQELHPEEYQKAVAKNEKLSKRMTEIALGLNRVYELAGEEGFKKASELANGVFETQQRLLSNYVAKATGASAQNRAVENDFRFKNPNASVKILDSLTAEQIRLKRNFKNKFGIDLFYGEIGTKDGLNKKFGVTLDEKTIVIDEAQMGQLSEQEILNKIVKEELVHTLQFTEGIITPRTLFEINKAMGNTDIIPKELDPAYSKETGLTKLSEAQAKAVAEVLLFDKLTVSKMFYTQYSTMNKVYRFFKNIKTKIEESKQLRSEKGKLKYNTLLKAMKMYREIAAEKIGNAENYDTVVKDFQLTQQEAQQLKDAYVEKTDVGPIENYETVMYAKERNPDKIPELYDENGEPKTFYKGADVSGITQFDNSLGNKKDIIPGASWFSDSRYIASTYVDKNNPESSIYSAKLNVKNPLVIDAQGRLFSEAFEGQNTNQLAQDAKEKGHDALIIKNVIDHGMYDFALETSTVVAVFDQTRVEITAEDKDILRKERDTKKAREILFGETIRTQPKKTDAKNTAIHFGDFSKGIIKAEPVSSWNSKRNTGAFGTGTYLFSVEAADTRAALGYNNDAKKSRYLVDINNYNLFKPVNNKQADLLHEALADVNNYVLENDKYLEQVEKEVYRDIDSVVTELSDILHVSTNKIYDILLKAADNDYKTYDTPKGDTTDTPATILMKSLGYDGIDVRGLSEFDTSEYGTVIYDLKETDVEQTKKERPTLTTKDGRQIELDLETISKQEQPIKRRTLRKAVRKWSDGVQLTIFDSIDPSMSVKDREATRLRASEQEIPMKELKLTQKVMEKANSIKELCSELAESEYQGDIENHKFATLTNEIFEKGADLFGEITPDEWQTIRAILFVDSTDPRASAALNAVTRYAYLHRANQFESIADLVKTVYANNISSAGQLIGLSAHDYNNHSVQSFVAEIAMKNGVDEIPLPDKIILNMLPEFKSVDDLKQSLKTEINEIKQRAKNSKDAYEKWELNRRASSKERVLTALNDNDIAVAIDEQMTTLLESNENVTENLKRQNATYSAIIEWLLEHAEFDNKTLKGFSDKKTPLSKNLEKAKTFFEGLESFRYMMMLSNPATALKNAISNTLVLGQSYVEDFATKIFENKNFLSGVDQIRYTGEFDSDFSKWVDDNYLEKVKSDAEGDKYTSNELRRLQQKYAEAKDPVKKSKILSTIQNLERKLLNDKFWVTHRTMMNLKNTLAGSTHLILSDARSWLVSKYKGKLSSSEITDTQLIENISKTNKELASLYESSIAGDKVAVMKLATKLNLDIISPDLKYQQSIYYHSFYRANKMFFKTDNWFTRVMSNLNTKHPGMAYVVRHFVPFVRVMANTTSYVIDRSPIGLAKGIVQAFQTKARWTYQMQTAIEQYYKQQYTKIMSQQNSDFKFEQNKFDEWLNNTVDTKTKQALAGDKKIVKEVFDAMAKQGWVNSGLIGSDNLYARAEVMEKLAQGTTGTIVMALGMLLASVTDAFEYDDDDEYLGAVVKIGDIKIGLSELSPFSTMFTIGAMLNSKEVDNNIEAAFNIFADATILSTLDSALSYSNGTWDYLKNQSIAIIGQYQPAITKAISKLVNNSKKDKSGEWGVKLLKTLGANSLIFNHLVPDKINPYTGEPEKYYDTGWFEGLFDVALPIGVRVDARTDFEKEAERLKAETSGLSGKFTINDVDYTLTGKTKQKYATYKAQYINNRFDNIINGNEKVTIKDEKTGKYKTTTYDKLTNEEKQRVLKNLYSKGTEVTKIQYWLDQGNRYYVSDKEQYWEYKKIFGSDSRIIYNKNWKKSKFVEGE